MDYASENGRSVTFRASHTLSSMKPQDAHFDDVAASYDTTISDHVIEHLTTRRVALAKSLISEGSVLDVGCGTGRFLHALPEPYKCTGIDLSPGMIERAREKGLNVFEGSGSRLPFQDDSFDLVTTFAVLHHLIDPQKVKETLSEMARVARPGGALIVWDHNPLNPYWRILMAKVPQDQGDEQLVPARLIISTLRLAQMRNVRLQRLTFMPEFTPPVALSAIARLERVLERVPVLNFVAAHNVVTARS